MVCLKPLPERWRFITRELPSPVNLKQGIRKPPDGFVFQKPISNRREETSQGAEKIVVSEEPVAKWSSLLICVLCLGDEIQLRDVYSGGAGHVAEMAADAEVNPLIHRRLARRPKSLSPRTRLFRPGELRAHPRNRADACACGTANTNIRIGLRPFTLFQCHDSPGSFNDEGSLFETPNSKLQIPNKSQIPILNDQNHFVLTLEFPNPPIPPLLKGGRGGIFHFHASRLPTDRSGAMSPSCKIYLVFGA